MTTTTTPVDMVLQRDFGQFRGRGPDTLPQVNLLDDAPTLGRIVVGDLAAAGANCAGSVFVPKRFTTRRGALASATDRDGNLWVLIGTDSGFEGRTTYFITQIGLRLRRLSE